MVLLVVLLVVPAAIWLLGPEKAQKERPADVTARNSLAVSL